jgi:hypothetical protein
MNGHVMSLGFYNLIFFWWQILGDRSLVTDPWRITIFFQFEIDHRILLTGTPIQNNLKELYSLLAFCASVVFRTRYEEQFVDRYTDAGDKGRERFHLSLWTFEEFGSKTLV